MTIITFILFKIDKKRAIKGKIRLKEKTLLIFSSLGGALGAFFGRIFNHHKTEKKYFSILIYFSLILELIILSMLLLRGIR
jgi:uncharacterized membrane protein YsdA (DUF1294 family)